MSTEQYPRIGTSVVVHRRINGRDCVLMGKRKGGHGAGCWAFPGGHLEWNEEIEECGRRELREETGMHALDPITRAGYTDTRFFAEGKHYVTLILHCRAEGEPQLLEPERCEGWEWVPIDALPEPVFEPINGYTDQLRQGMPATS